MRESKATMASFSKATELLSDLSGTLVVSNELSLQKQYFPLVGTVTFAQFSLAHDLLDVGDEDPDLVCVDLVLSVPLLRLVTLVREEHREGQQGGVLETHAGALDQWNKGSLTLCACPSVSIVTFSIWTGSEPSHFPHYS